MVFGLLKDTKKGEYRVICTPLEIASITGSGHKVLVEKNAGKAAGFPDEAYVRAGAEIVESREEVWRRSDMVAKVKNTHRMNFP